MSKPNILLVVADCLRSDYLTGIKGRVKAPFLDRMTESGTIFTEMIAAMSITTPNFTSILSGRYPVEHGVRFLSSQKPAVDDLKLVPHLKAEGYSTYGLMTGPLFEEIGLGHGFDIYEYRKRHEYLDSDWGKDLKNRIRSKGFQEPWFILLHLWELHQPRRIPRVPNGYSGTPYERALVGLDSQLERLWKAVSESTERPTIGALTGDHGEWVETNKLNEIWRKGLARFRKFSMPDKPKANWHGYHAFDYLTKVPLVVWGSSVTSKVSRISQQVRQIDLIPTILEAADLEVPRNTTGYSVWPLANGRFLPETPAFLEASGDVGLLYSQKWLYGVRYGGWKYIFRPQMKSHETLYNLNRDPAEKRNVLEQHPEKAAELQHLIDSDYLDLGNVDPSAELDLAATEARLRDLGYF